LENNHQIEVTEIRPRFRKQVSLSKDEVFALLKDTIKHSNQVTGNVVGDHVYIKIATKDQHYWSPELNLDCEQNNEGTLIRCLIGPRQTVWAMFLFMYGVVSLLGLFGGMYGLTLWQMGKGNNWLWTFPIALFLLISIFIAAKIGQQIGREQMLLLINFLNQTLQKSNSEK
jgi:hypothetical protein